MPVSEFKSKKPKDLAFMQQRVKAWQFHANISPMVVISTSFVAGLACLGGGVALLMTSLAVQEFILDYTKCASYFTNLTNKGCYEYIQSSIQTEIFAQPCYCNMSFQLADTMRKDVFFYYGLRNFYQNHRRYVKSIDQFQLGGDLTRTSHPDCKSQKEDPETKLPIVPCGAIPNSKFNDEIEIYHITVDGVTVKVPLLDTGIVWPSDKSKKYRNPEPRDNLKEAFKDTAKPPAWQYPIYNLSSNPNNNGFENEDLLVWIKTAALPTFRKLYRRIDHEQELFQSGLPQGKYYFFIKYNFKVDIFDGTKELILSNTSMLGGYNLFLGMLYVACGAFCVFGAIMFCAIKFIHKPKPVETDI